MGFSFSSSFFFYLMNGRVEKGIRTMREDERNE